jgi:hypothetical protein
MIEQHMLKKAFNLTHIEETIPHESLKDFMELNPSMGQEDYTMDT